MWGRDLDHTVIARFETVGSIPGLTDELPFENIYALLEGMDVGVNGAAGVKLTNAEFLVDRTSFAIDNAPAAITLVQRFKRLGNLEVGLLCRTDDMSGWH
jgi:hypothetical protein